MNHEIIQVDSDKCNKCMRCISVCPIKFCISVDDKAVSINHDKCISCGACVTTCQTEARSIKDDFKEFKETQYKKKFIAVVAPAVAAVFGKDYLKFNTFLKDTYNINAIFDVSFGAEISTRGYIEYIKKNNPKTVITQPCPSLVNYIEMYKPDLIRYLAPVQSPMICTINNIRANFRQYHDHEIVVLSPCAAKRIEFNSVYPSALNVTFSSILDDVHDQRKPLKDLKETPYDGPEAERAVLFSSPGGLKRTVERTFPELSPRIRKVEGTDIVYKYLDDLKRNIEKGHAPLIADCLNCEKGCNGGPGTDNDDLSIDELESAVEFRSMQNINKKSQKKIDKIVDQYYSSHFVTRSYVNRSIRTSYKIPSGFDLENIYRSMDKHTDDDLYDCTSCGYNSCEKMAIAIFNNLNTPENCHHFQMSELHKAQAKKKEIAEQLEKIIFSTNQIITSVWEKMNKLGDFTSEQVSAIEESSAAIQQMIASINSIAGTTSSKKPLIIHMGEQFATINLSLSDIVKSVDSIESVMEEVNEMNNLIDDVSNRTNLLSMNAAIEAARSGTVGKGFSVVANEIRKLADESSASVNKIKTCIRSVIDHVKESSDISHKSKDHAIYMSNTVENVTDGMSEISNGMNELSIGSSEISQSIEIMASSSRDINIFFSDAKEATEDMINKFKDLENLVRNLIDE